MQKLLIIDRDGTLIKEAPPTYQVDCLEKLEFYPGVFQYLGRIVTELDYELIMVTNQDGLGTESFPESSFLPIQNHVIKCFKNEGICFSAIYIDNSLPETKSVNRKPGTGMLTKYLQNNKYDLKNSIVIGDRITDVQLAVNLGCKAIWLNNDPALGRTEIAGNRDLLQNTIALETINWKDIYSFLKTGSRKTVYTRKTNETDIQIELSLDGSGHGEINTGLRFFDHMLDQLTRHSMIDLSVKVKGDLEIDEHHTIEDTAIALGEIFAKALGNKKGIERYGFALPMDDAEAKVLLDLGGRSWLIWNAEFKRDKIGDVPTEMFFHFFKSFSDAAKCNLNIECRGENEHHKIEAIFKALAKAIRMAIIKNHFTNALPTTKGVI